VVVILGYENSNSIFSLSIVSILYGPKSNTVGLSFVILKESWLVRFSLSFSFWFFIVNIFIHIMIYYSFNHT